MSFIIAKNNDINIDNRHKININLFKDVIINWNRVNNWDIIQTILHCIVSLYTCIYAIIIFLFQGNNNIGHIYMFVDLNVKRVYVSWILTLYTRGHTN